MSEAALVSGLVRDAHDAPELLIGEGAAVREIIDPSVGCMQFSMRLVRVVGAHTAERDTGETEELLFVLAGRGRLVGAGDEHELEAETGALLAPGERYEIVGDDAQTDLLVVSVALHEPAAAGEGHPTGVRLSRLADQLAQSATGERTFRIVFDPERGCATATQFVGYIPVGAAPRHYHLYDEVIYVLDGEGVMHMDGRETPLHAGSAIHLPSRKLHTLANSGPGIMRVLGVFRPAGSPAAAFYPDGRPAYTPDES